MRFRASIYVDIEAENKDLAEIQLNLLVKTLNANAHETTHFSNFYTGGLFQLTKDFNQVSRDMEGI